MSDLTTPDEYIRFLAHYADARGVIAHNPGAMMTAGEAASV